MALDGEASTSWLLRGGPIRAMDTPDPAADALLVREGRIAFVGPESRLDPAMARGAEVVDLQGRALLPGLCDSHLHLLLAAGEHATLDLGGAESVDEVRRRVAARAHPEPEGCWVMGQGWEARRLGGGGPLRPRLLEGAAGTRPVFLVGKDWHSAWLNSAAMACLRALPGPLPGKCRVEQLPDGGDGLVYEDIVSLRDALVPPLPAGARLARLGPYLQRLHSLGITAVHTHETLEDFRLLAQALADGGPRLRVLCNLLPGSLDQVAAFGELRHEALPGWLVPGAVKLFLDGTFGSMTAAVSEPYRRGGAGELLMDPEELGRWVDAARAVGMPAAAHAIGDRAVGMFLEALRGRAPARAGLDRVEHAQLLNDDILAAPDLPRVAFSVQPSHMWGDRAVVADQLRGRSAERWCYPLNSLTRAGALLLFGSDAPVEEPDPWRGIQAAVGRLEQDDAPPWIPEEGISMQAALAAHTVNPARVHGASLGGGVLAPGQPADMVVLNRDPLALSAGERARLPQLMRAEMTFLQGALVYSRGA